ncbi:MAG: endo alpha-1,4 polygalactosaminidase [Saprospiraceae bacterium]|nr:endo alpha-1,4 polygalactosaminidase [Saprospiraceae bacterium]MCF8248660.1 endo alpha-1,4 polygalactosaminidase [Saprospiraceae bacterium]MCF8278850.1 endo alpha-1,4 polygalactosaminidase [Bacteroidales bacterium]MCF8310650.1 endo alpha-1,4 polygalactosaminidase [Saprospiraceae bacterium]MCF8439209.1 endo alpha-1,4 polygalactosaminidase [Saprospiraceae bacterium]
MEVQVSRKSKMLGKFFSLLLICTLLSCNKDDGSSIPAGLDFKAAMRSFVIGISQYSKAKAPSFLIIPQNGIELVTENGEVAGPLASAYLAAVDGHGQEDLFYGYDADNKATPSADNAYLRNFLDISKNNGKAILVTDYCSTPAKMDDAYAQNAAAGYTSFAADHRDLDNIPVYPNPIHSENNAVVTSLTDTKNFLYLINPTNFTTKAEFIEAVAATNYDLLIMDLFFQDDMAFSAAEIEQLKNKTNGGKRLVVSYMSIGEAEDYRYYWQPNWNSKKPDWMDSENPDWAGNFKVKYWEKAWQDIIYGNDNSYLKKILDAGFDGVYLDIVDAFEFYE